MPGPNISATVSSPRKRQKALNNQLHTWSFQQIYCSTRRHSKRSKSHLIRFAGSGILKLLLVNFDHMVPQCRRRSAFADQHFGAVKTLCVIRGNSSEMPPNDGLGLFALMARIEKVNSEDVTCKQDRRKLNYSKNRPKGLHWAHKDFGEGLLQHSDSDPKTKEEL